MPGLGEDLSVGQCRRLRSARSRVTSRVTSRRRGAGRGLSRPGSAQSVSEFPLNGVVLVFNESMKGKESSKENYFLPLVLLEFRFSVRLDIALLMILESAILSLKE